MKSIFAFRCPSAEHPDWILNVHWWTFDEHQTLIWLDLIKQLIKSSLSNYFVESMWNCVESCFTCDEPMMRHWWKIVSSCSSNQILISIHPYFWWVENGKMMEQLMWVIFGMHFSHPSRTHISAQQLLWWVLDAQFHCFSHKMIIKITSIIIIFWLMRVSVCWVSVQHRTFLSDCFCVCTVSAIENYVCLSLVRDMTLSLTSEGHDHVPH